MRILHVISSADLSHGGPIEHAVKIGIELERRGHSHEFLTIDPPNSPAARSIPATVHAVGRRRAVPTTGAMAKLVGWLSGAPDALPWLRRHQSDYDVIIVSGLWNHMTLVASRALAHGRMAYVVFTHGMLDPWFNRTYPLKTIAKRLLWLVSEGVLLRRADLVLFTCEEERVLAQHSFRPYRARERVVAFGTADAPPADAAQDAAFRAAVSLPPGSRYLLFLSRIHRKKGVDLLIEAFGAIATKYPELYLVVAGPDPDGLVESLKERARALGCADRIRWPGMLRGNAKWGAFRGCEAFALPSHQENFGIVVAEAMACGRPVLISDKVNIWREIAADGAGLVEPDTAEGTLRLLTRFLQEAPAERSALGSRGRDAFVTRFHIAGAADDLERVLKEVVERRRQV